MKILEKLQNIDEKISSIFFNMELPSILQYYIAIFSIVCNKEGSLVLLIANVFFFE